MDNEKDLQDFNLEDIMRQLREIPQEDEQIAAPADFTEPEVSPTHEAASQGTVDADALASKASTPEIKAVAKKVYEVIRYSDPMSNDKLAGVELKIEKLFDEYQNAVNANDYELVKQTASALTEAVEERNKKCKLLK